MANDKERTRALDLAISQIEKQFGKGANQDGNLKKNNEE